MVELTTFHIMRVYHDKLILGSKHDISNIYTYLSSCMSVSRS